MGKRGRLSFEDLVKGGAQDPAYSGLLQKVATAAGYVLHGDGPRRESEAAELKKFREQLTELAGQLGKSKLTEAAEAKALVEFAVTKIDAGFARLSGEG